MASCEHVKSSVLPKWAVDHLQCWIECFFFSKKKLVQWAWSQAFQWYNFFDILCNTSSYKKQVASFLIMYSRVTLIPMCTNHGSWIWKFQQFANLVSADCSMLLKFLHRQFHAQRSVTGLPPSTWTPCLTCVYTVSLLLSLAFPQNLYNRQCFAFFPPHLFLFFCCEHSLSTSQCSMFKVGLDVLHSVSDVIPPLSHY